jgi:hypothetical protein
VKTLRKILTAAAVTLVAGPALAAVNNSHHDLSAFQGATEVCLFCHGVLDTTAATGNFGNVGELCLSRCHNGGGFVAAATGVIPNRPATIDDTGAPVAAVETVNAVNVVAGTGAHGLTKANLLDALDGTTVVGFDGIGLALPYGGNATIECTSCHNVHDNTNTPFLQGDLFTGGTAARPSFCEACHTDRGNSWAGGEVAPNGEHPTNFALVLGDSTRTLGARNGRYINLDGTIFEQAVPADLNVPANEYVTGGKVSGFANATGGETFGCYTCHSAHADINLGAQTPNLILRNATSANAQWNPICVGCHGQEATGVDDDNPGLAASAFFHPVGTAANATTGNTGTVYSYATSTGSFSFDVELDPIINVPAVGAIADSVVGFDATTGRPSCGSCHDVHGGATNSMALIDLDGTRDGTMAGKVCDNCHNGVGLPDVADDSGNAGEAANSHHRTRTGSWATATVTDADGNTLNLDGADAASWLVAADHTNGLGCADCHVFDGSTHSTAHNW